MIFKPILLIVCGLLFYACNMKTKSTNRPDAVYDDAYIAVDETEKSIPVIQLGKKEAVSFVVKNIGKKPLEIVNTQSDCGCTVAAYTKQPIAPGATGTVTVNIASERVGEFRHFVVVQTNAINSFI